MYIVVTLLDQGFIIINKIISMECQSSHICCITIILREILGIYTLEVIYRLFTIRYKTAAKPQDLSDHFTNLDSCSTPFGSHCNATNTHHPTTFAINGVVLKRSIKRRHIITMLMLTALSVAIVYSDFSIITTIS